MALATRRTRRDDGIQWKIHSTEWIDPFPWILGTRPEKMIFAELVSRHIFFKNQVLLTELIPSARGIPVLSMNPYRADFAIPSVKVILDPWDDYHHSLPDQAKADAIKLAVYRALGWKTYHWWASDLEKYGAGWALDQCRELPQHGKGGYKLYHLTDDTAGIRAANASRRVNKAPTLRRRTRRGRRTT